ncbi:VWA domain-containing protein [Streptosporangiaceae bacterium NEAU-GS5]|nr:VWA domain-containing protein [Streptosporangiaceae bacterium NEAU-GS5]
MAIAITPMKPEEVRPLPGGGLGALETPRGNLPLESVGVTAKITGLSAGVEVVQGYRNPYDVTLEATYVFPLPPRAAVTAFQMEADGHVVEGVLKERGQARADYDQALAEGRRAAIAEEDRPDVFAIRVGNILPGERVTIRLSLSQPLPYEDDAAEFRFPLVVAPRYIPGEPLDGTPAGDGTAPDTDAVPDASRISPPVLLPGFPNPVRLSLSAAIDPAGLTLREIRSSLHEVVQEGDTVALRPGERLDRDFILRLAYEATDRPALAVTPDTADGSEGTFTLTVVPPSDVDGTARGRDVVLLLDRSGSMTGWKMVAARRAAARIVDTLTSRDRFAVLAFDSVVERAFDSGLVEASDRNRYRAVEHLGRLDARGGTELLAPMEEGLRLLTDATRDRVMVLVTDGQVGNEDQIIDRIAGSARGVRIHSVGIDRAVNAGFLGRLAMLGSGRCELVESEDRLDVAMEHIHRRIGSPLVTDLSLHPEGLQVIAGTVTHLGAVYPGVPLVVSGRFSGPAAGTMAVRGTTADGRPWEATAQATRTDSTAPRTQWARAHLRALEDRYAAGDTSLESAIVAASLKFGVLCRFTAFVAVDTRVVAEGGPEHRVSQPVELPSGWEMPMPAAIPAAAPMMAKMATFTSADPMAPPAPGGPPPFGPTTLPTVEAGGAASEVSVARPAARRRPAHGFAGAPMPPSPPGPKPAATTLDGVRPQLEEELSRLSQAAGLSEGDRRRYLADLGSRLRVLADMIDGHADLTALADELDRAEWAATDLEALWRRTAELLSRLTGTAGQPIRRTFWKRS